MKNFWKITVNKGSCQNLGLWLLIPFASVISHTWLSVPPTMICFLLSVLCCLLLYDGNLTKNPLSCDRWQIQAILPVCFFAFYIFLEQYFMGAQIRRYWSVVCAALYFPVCIGLVGKSPLRNWKNKIDWFIYIAALIYILEAIGRYGVVIYKIINGSSTSFGIYRFKFDGPMFFESNGTAIHLIIILFFVLWWYNYQKRQIAISGVGDEPKKKALLWENKKLFSHYRKLIFLFIILLFLTLSRACVFAAILGLIYFFVPKRKNLLLILAAFLVLISVFGLFVIYPLFRYDLSFMSKFDIFNYACAYLQTATLWQWLFGVGLSESDKVMLIYAHNYWLVFLVETGISGLLALVYMFIHFIWKTKGVALYVLLPFFLATASSSVTFIPELYIAMAIMFLTIKRKDKEGVNSEPDGMSII